ncbi:MAG: UvrD-helicase domain-containing protein, partial [Candidatus Enteromonas sp.]|nr:UvrD-helicase domain-containing protein [Candidatus Enteromonas sp.]
MSDLIDQKDRDGALHSKEGNHLISAGAGSGKTFTLANRIIELMAEKNPDGTYKRHFSELLVMTFTKKAAAEMKDRTRKFLRESGKYDDLLPEVENASIVTFDAFALQIVKKFHYELGLGGDVQNLDEGIINIKKKELLEQILMEKYEGVKSGKEERFASLIRRHEMKDDDDIANIVLKLLAQADLSPDKDAFFDELPKQEFSDSLMDEAIQAFFNYQKELVNKTYEDLLSNAGLFEDCQEALDENLKIIQSLSEITDYDTFYSTLTTIKFKQYRGLDEEAKKTKDSLMGPFNDAKSAVKAHGESKAIKERILRTKDDVLEIIDLAKRLSERIDAFKKEKNAWSFADIAKLAAKAVTIPSVKKELQERYHYIMIDEYQDTSDLQEAFVNSLECPNVFQVGDMKQSIYGFRNANPSLFLSKYKDYQAHKGGTLYQLSANFRTRGPMLESINDMFDEIMTTEVGGVDYRNGHALAQGNKSYVEGSVDHHAVLVKYGAVYNEDRGKTEAQLIAEDIQRKVAEKYQIFNKEKKVYRDCTYSDFAVLVDKRTELDAYKKVFSEYKIPFEASEKGERSEAEITIALKNLSRFAVIFEESGEQAEKEKKHLYVSLSRSFLLRSKDKEIFEGLKVNDKWKESPLYRFFFEHHKELLSANLEDALALFIDHFEIIEKLPLLGEVKENYELLDSFEHLAASMSKLGYKLKEFSEYFEQLEKYDESFNVAPSFSGNDVVRYLTIHQSKGLEYPIIYLPSLFHSFESQMNRKANNSAYKTSARFGLIIPSIQDEVEAQNGIEDTTQSTVYAFVEKLLAKKEALSEKMRLFYVALTRAKEGAYLYEMDKGDKPLVSDPRNAKRFDDFLDCYSNKKGTLKVEVTSGPTGHKGNGRSLAGDFKPFEYHSISVTPEVKNVARASKEAHGLPDEGALRFGERLHRLLELSDFASKDSSWIKEDAERKLIQGVLSLSLFEKAGEAKVYHEYAFYDEDNDLNGIIDLLLVYPDHIDLVDFK